MAIISGEDLDYLKQRFAAELKSGVELNLFTRASYHTPEAEAQATEANQEDDDTGEMFAGEASRVTAQILEELAAIAPDKITVVTHDMDSPDGVQMAEQAGLNAEMLPAIAFDSENLKGQSRYYGLPSGYEFGSLIENVVDLSSGNSELRPATVEKLATVNQPVQIMVFVTPT